MLDGFNFLWCVNRDEGSEINKNIYYASFNRFCLNIQIDWMMLLSNYL